VPENTTVALVGESGSGKSVTAMSVLNLLPDNAERSGRMLWQGRDLLQASLADLQALRGKEIACVFQDPMSSLNPVFTVGQQLVRAAGQAPGAGQGAAWRAPRSCCPRWASPNRSAGWAATRTRCRAASSSA
jgi:peptide/nickel transport system ATP-binding protein